MREPVYESFEAYSRAWLEAFRALGHEPMLHDEDGAVDVFAYTVGNYHNGPRCRRCGEGLCQHCHAPGELAEHLGPCRGESHKRAKEREAREREIADAKAVLTAAGYTVTTPAPGN